MADVRCRCGICSLTGFIGLTFGLVVFYPENLTEAMAHSTQAAKGNGFSPGFASRSSDGLNHFFMPALNKPQNRFELSPVWCNGIPAAA